MGYIVTGQSAIGVHVLEGYWFQPGVDLWSTHILPSGRGVWSIPPVGSAVGWRRQTHMLKRIAGPWGCSDTFSESALVLLWLDPMRSEGRASWHAPVELYDDDDNPVSWVDGVPYEKYGGSFIAVNSAVEVPGRMVPTVSVFRIGKDPDVHQLVVPEDLQVGDGKLVLRTEGKAVMGWVLREFAEIPGARIQDLADVVPE